jgi:hypothetical protein
METRRIPDIDHYAMIDWFGRSEFNDGVEETRYLAFRERLLKELAVAEIVHDEGSTDPHVELKLVERR